MTMVMAVMVVLGRSRGYRAGDGQQSYESKNATCNLQHVFSLWESSCG